ncbi:MAG: HNH endonuclease [Clostridium lundense]|nr:HNH endonuclease [Clostridium lundense]
MSCFYAEILILLKLEYLMGDNTVHLSGYKRISVEHVLPQNPSDDSQWIKDFSKEEREKWTHRIANLVLISQIKNSKLSNLDFIDKKNKYLKQRVGVFHANKIFLQQNDAWTSEILEKRQKELVDTLIEN